MAEGARRVCLIGPESTGKSQLAARVARDLGLPCVTEYAREYAVEVNRPLTADDVEPIARGEMALLDAAGPTAIVDTDLVSTVVYARYYYGSCPEWIVEAAIERRASLYLLLDTDLPWKSDEARDASTADMREDLFDAFRATLEGLDCRFVIVSGGFTERWIRVKELVTRFLEE